MGFVVFICLRGIKFESKVAPYISVWLGSLFCFFIYGLWFIGYGLYTRSITYTEGLMNDVDYKRSGGKVERIYKKAL